MIIFIISYVIILTYYCFFIDNRHKENIIINALPSHRLLYLFYEIDNPSITLKTIGLQ